MVRSIPPGGNWKNIPTSIPSRRLEQIRRSYRNGEGSRSTYYGRLHPHQPAYTISTYFTRPGNGCNIHYAQDRVISEREAARLQTFPDSFRFFGSHRDITKQIGNAVPPLLGFQIALCLGEPGLYVDLFCGAGGLSLGFKWAGWHSVVANDIEPSFLETYSKNLGTEVVPGSIESDSVLSEIVRLAADTRRLSSGIPLWILGGPPCQGFSTAGNRRSRNDSRNLLFERYTSLVRALEPDGFVFENVTGMLNMERGAVFQEIQDSLRSVTGRLFVWKLSAEQYGIPQRRRRVFLVGVRDKERGIASPEHLCGDTTSHLFRQLHPLVGVEEALRDLPPIEPGEDGSHKGYLSPPRAPFQQFVRGNIGAFEYLDEIRRVETTSKV